jgi:glycosyltransferase involved in cell wall biosynthesis
VKIIHALGWYFPDSIGGTELYASAVARALRDAGHEVLIAAPDATMAAPRQYTFAGVRVFRYPIPAQPTRAEAQGRLPARGAEQFHAWLRAQRPDVVHAHTFVTGLGLHELRAARAGGARVIATTHSSSLGFLCQRGTLMRWGRAVCEGPVDAATCAACALHHAGVPRAVAMALSDAPPVLSATASHIPGRLGTALGMNDLIEWNEARQRELWSLVDRFVVLTEWARDALVRHGAPPEKLAVNRLGISSARDAARPDLERRGNGHLRVGYLGRFDPVKGIEDLVDALMTLPDSTPVTLEIRGPAAGSAERSLRRRLQERVAATTTIAIEDPVAPEDVPALLRSFDVICCPSRCLEGGPTVALEAMAAGTPVIAARPSGAAEVMQDGVNGFLFDAGDVRGLSAALERVAHDRAIVGQWRTALPPIRTMDEVARDYLAMYAGA